MAITGTDEAGRALDAARPVLLPLPTPLGYALAGTDAAAVNRAKGRDAGQPVGMVVAGFDLVRPLLNRIGHLYLSSADVTGGEVALTAADADAAFRGALPTLDGDAARDPSVPSGSATILRVAPGGRVGVARSGIQDAAYGGDTERFLRQILADRGQGRPGGIT